MEVKAALEGGVAEPVEEEQSWHGLPEPLAYRPRLPASLQRLSDDQEDQWDDGRSPCGVVSRLVRSRR